MIINQEIDLAGKIRILWQSTATGNTYTYKFDAQPSNEILEQLAIQSDFEYSLQSLPNLNVIEPGAKEIVKNAIIAVHESENLNFETYTNYLNELSWKDKAIVQYYMGHIANILQTANLIEVDSEDEQSIFENISTFLLGYTLKELQFIFNLN